MADSIPDSRQGGLSDDTPVDASRVAAVLKRLHRAGTARPGAGRATVDQWIDDLARDSGAGPGLVPLLRWGRWIDPVLSEDRPVTAEDLNRLPNEYIRAGALLLLLTLDRRVGGRRGHMHWWSRPELDTLHLFARRKLGWTGEEMVLLWWAFAQLANLDHWHVYAGDLFRLPLSAAEEVPPQQREPILATVRALHEKMTGIDAFPCQAAERVRITRRLAGLLPTPVGQLPPAILGGTDQFGPSARAALLTEFGAARAVPILRHLAEYAGGVRPTKRWQQQLADLLETDPAGGEVAVRLLELTLAHREAPTERTWGDGVYVEYRFVADETAQLLRAAVWAASAFAALPERSSEGAASGPADRGAAEGTQTPSERVLAVLADAAVHCGTTMVGGEVGALRCTQVTSSAVAALSEQESVTGPAHPDDAGVDLAVSHLARIQTKVKNRALAKTIDRALEAVAARAGVTPGQLVERSVPTFDLRPAGPTAVSVGDHTAVLTVVPPGAVSGTATGVRLSWRSTTGREMKTVPKAVREGHGPELAALRSRAKEATKVLATERTRVEDLLADDRDWSAAEWVSLYLTHPLTSAIARRLIWQARTQEGWASGIPAPASVDTGDSAGLSGWMLTDHDGVARPVSTDTTVRLWHPIREPVAEVAAWREALTAREFRQPFKQAFREVYLLTPAEEGTRSYSNRFAAHVLRYPQAGALMRARGWAGGHLGYWDGGFNGEAVRELGETGWRARFYYDLVESGDDEYGVPALCSTDQVRFERAVDVATSGAGAGRQVRWENAALVDVPALPFSEAMRDVDLFVGVPSIAADPEWVDRGQDRHLDYWQRTSFGDLGALAQVRRDALVRLMPRTKIADKVRVTDRFLEVDGALHTYKIHLGSGNILMSPNDAYLCIVPSRDQGSGSSRNGKVFLPFEEDGGLLSLIVSKAFLLADDLAITDATILAQIKRR